MRLRLGLLQEPAAIERQVQREAQEAAARKVKAEAPTVKTEAQTRADEAAKVHEKDKARDKATKAKPHIRPLSESKAIDSGANFISESFLFTVGLSLILFETWRSRRKEQNRRNDVAEKLAELEARDHEKDRLLHALEEELEKVKGKRDSSGSRWALPGSQLFSSGMATNDSPTRQQDQGTRAISAGDKVPPASPPTSNATSV